MNAPRESQALGAFLSSTLFGRDQMRYLDLFKKHVDQLSTPKASGEATGLCPFHPNTDTAAFSVNVVTGKFKCWSPKCGKKGGVKTFRKLIGEADHPPIPQSKIDSFHKALMNTPSALDYLTSKRGLSLEVIKEHRLGYDGDRYWIPVFDASGVCVNARLYSPTDKRKMIHFGEGYGETRLYPLSSMQSDSVVIAEGEFDTLVLLSHGIPAVTSTSGADSWTRKLNAPFKGKKVTICYDADDAGKTGAKKTAKLLAPIAASIAIAALPLPGPPEAKDVTDFMRQEGATGEALRGVLSDAVAWNPEAEEESSRPPPSQVPDEVVETHLADSGFSDYAYRRIRTRVIVAGKDLAPYAVPWKVKFECEGGHEKCEGCGIYRSGGRMNFEFDETYQHPLQMIASPNAVVLQCLADIASVPGRCRQFTYEVEEYANIESVKCIPEIDWTSEGGQYVIRQLFFIGHGLETNKSYQLEAVVMPEPKTQYATALVYDAVLENSNIESFEMNEEVFDLLKGFQA